MSAPDGARAQPHRAAPADSAAAIRPLASEAAEASVGAPIHRSPRPALARARSSSYRATGVARLSAYAWATIAVTIAFIALTCWWLTQDRSIPIYDAGDHLATAFLFHDMLRSGNLLGPFNYESPYPPIGVLVGAFASLIGGVNVAAPIIGENLVFVSLLTLGCYQTGRLLYGARAGMLAAILVLGSPLLIAQLHVFMLDAPTTALVAVSIWLLLACEDFRDTRLSALAGVAAGIGMLVKVQYPPFIMGIVLMMLLRGGWRNRRGLLAFALIAIVIAAPWYLNHLAEFSTFSHDAGRRPGFPPGDDPPTLTTANFTWYFWNMLNSQFLAPLFALVVGGTVWIAFTLLRHPRAALHASAGAKAGAETDPDGRALGARLEFFVGAFSAWLLLTLTPAHDIRYGLPMLPYLAVVGTGWIVHLPRIARGVALAVLVCGVLANTLSTTFGVGGEVQVVLASRPPVGEDFRDRVKIYTSEGFLVAGPRRDGDVPGLLASLRSHGVRTIAWSLEQSRQPDFSFEGLIPLARIANLSTALTRTPEFSRSPSVATLIHSTITSRTPPPCTRLSDGTGVWVVRHDPATGQGSLYCPSRHPQFYSTPVPG
jgi:dolichyl-phosphate-mannose-protein mannosyltransferase